MNFLNFRSEKVFRPLNGSSNEYCMDYRALSYSVKAMEEYERKRYGYTYYYNIAGVFTIGKSILNLIDTALARLSAGRAISLGSI